MDHEPAQLFINPQTGATRRYQKFIRDLEGLYFDLDAYLALATHHANDLAYEVYEYRPNENKTLIVDDGADGWREVANPAYKGKIS